MHRGVTRGWAGVLVTTLGFYKKWRVRMGKKMKGKQNYKKFLFAYPTLNPGGAPGDAFITIWERHVIFKK